MFRLCCPGKSHIQPFSGTWSILNQPLTGMFHLEEISYFAFFIFTDAHWQILTGRPGTVSTVTISVHAKSWCVKSIYCHSTQINLPTVILSPLTLTIPTVMWCIDTCFLKIRLFSTLAESLIYKGRHIFQTNLFCSFIFKSCPYLNRCNICIKLHVILAFYTIFSSCMNYQFFSFFIFQNLMALIYKIRSATTDIVLICMHPSGSTSGDLNFCNRIKIFFPTISFLYIHTPGRVELLQFYYSVFLNFKNYF